MSKLYLTLRREKNWNDVYREVYLESMSKEYGIVQVHPHKKTIIGPGTIATQTHQGDLCTVQIDVEPNSKYFVVWKVVFVSGAIEYHYYRLNTGEVPKGPSGPTTHQIVKATDLETYDEFVVKIRDRIDNKNNSYI